MSYHERVSSQCASIIFFHFTSFDNFAFTKVHAYVDHRCFAITFAGLLKILFFFVLADSKS